MLCLFEEIEMPLVFALFDMEQNGVKVEAAELKEYGDRLAVQIEKLEKRSIKSRVRCSISTLRNSLE